MIARFSLIFLGSIRLFGQSGSGETAWNILQEGLADKSAETRAQAAHASGLMKNNSRAQAACEKLLPDKKPTVRAAAAGALGRMGAKSSADKVAELLKDPEGEVVVAAGNALQQLEDPRGYSVAYATLTSKKKTGQALLEGETKKLSDPKTLAAMGFKQGLGFIPGGTPAYVAVKTLTKDDTSPVRAAAAHQLAHDPDPRSAKALTEALSDKKPLVRAAAAHAIGQRDDPALANSLEPLFKDDEDAVRLTAAAAYLRLTLAQQAFRVDRGDASGRQIAGK
jgi:HEAT repeat protein